MSVQFKAILLGIAAANLFAVLIVEVCDMHIMLHVVSNESLLKLFVIKFMHPCFQICSQDFEFGVNCYHSSGKWLHKIKRIKSWN